MHNTDLAMTCNNCESQDDFTWLRNSTDDDGCYRCDNCGAIDDHRMAPELAEAPAPVWGRHIDPLMPAIERFLTRPAAAPRKPAARETQAILRQAARIRRIREELVEELS